MYVTLTEIKEYLKISSTTYDTLLNNINTRVQQLIENITNRAIDAKTIYKVYKVEDSNELILDENDVTSVFIVGFDVDLGSKEYSTLVTDYLFDNEKSIITFTDTTEGVGNYIYLEYETEFAEVGLKGIMLSMIAKKYYDIDQKRFGINSKSLIGENVSFSYSDISSENQKYLQQYRKYPISNGIIVSQFTKV